MVILFLSFGKLSYLEDALTNTLNNCKSHMEPLMEDQCVFCGFSEL